MFLWYVVRIATKGHRYLNTFVDHNQTNSQHDVSTIHFERWREEFEVMNPNDYANANAENGALPGGPRQPPTRSEWCQREQVGEKSLRRSVSTGSRGDEGAFVKDVR